MSNPTVKCFRDIKMKQFTDLHIENDKTNAPYFPAASFNSLIEFIGSHAENGILY